MSFNEYLSKITSFPSHCSASFWHIVNQSSAWWSPRERMDDATFCAKLPKTELHAHITGSIMPEILHEIWAEQKAENPEFDLEDPIAKLDAASKEMDGPRFFSLFSKYIYQLSNTRSRIQRCTRAILADFKRYGVEYLELRSIPRAAFDIKSKEDYVKTILEVLEDDSDNARAKRPARTYLILGVDRKLTPEEAQDTIDIAIKYKQRGVVGVDLSGNALKGDVTKFANQYQSARDAGLKITLHFAEIGQNSYDENKAHFDAELKALLSYDPDRLGHLVTVPKALKDEIRAKKVGSEKKPIGLELCVSSNVALKLIEGGVSKHHFSEWWSRRTNPIAICTDDVGVFRSNPSQEYELLMKHFHLSRRDVITLARSSVDCIFGTEDDRRFLLEKLDGFEREHAAEL